MEKVRNKSRVALCNSFMAETWESGPQYVGREVWSLTGQGEILCADCEIVRGGCGRRLRVGNLDSITSDSVDVAISWASLNILRIGAFLYPHLAGRLPRSLIHPKADVVVSFPYRVGGYTGPSAGAAVATSLVWRALSDFGLRTRQHCAVVGEVTLGGEVLRTGELLEKVVGARQAGIRWVAAPREDVEAIALETLDEEMRAYIQRAVKPVDHIVDVMRFALEGKTIGSRGRLA